MVFKPISFSAASANMLGEPSILDFLNLRGKNLPTIPPQLNDTTYEEFEALARHGNVFVVNDFARDWPYLGKHFLIKCFLGLCKHFLNFGCEDGNVVNLQKNSHKGT